MINSIMQELFLKMKIQSSMSEKEEKRQKIYDVLNAETKSKFLGVLYTKEKNYWKRAF